MTHEELLAKIDNMIVKLQKTLDKYAEQNNSLMIGSAKTILAPLRVVVELHKPRQEMTGWGTDTEPTYKTICGYCDVKYPCGEIQAIEKEIK